MVNRIMIVCSAALRLSFKEQAGGIGLPIAMRDPLGAALV